MRKQVKKELSIIIEVTNIIFEKHGRIIKAGMTLSAKYCHIPAFLVLKKPCMHGII